MRKQPTNAFPLNPGHITQGFRGLFGNETANFENAFSRYIGSQYAIASGSGTTAAYIALMAMKKLKPGRDEVVLPAYTVPTLTLAFEKAGLKTRLCDIEKDTLNMDSACLSEIVGKKTLAVIPVHMFGFPCRMNRCISITRDAGAYVLEDACQSLGSRLNGKSTGVIGDAGFFSLCKGKNISTFHGGLTVTDNEELAHVMREIAGKLPPRGIVYRAAVPFVLAALSMAMRPSFYGSLHSLISMFKSTTVHHHFEPSSYSPFMAGVANSLLPEMDRWNELRKNNGLAIIEGLKNCRGVSTPRIIGDAEPVFNHIPLLYGDSSKIENTAAVLLKNGIDTARMYEKPVHHFYPSLGYNIDPEVFPVATFVAPRLLIVPTHPMLVKEDIEKIVSSAGNC